MIAMSDGISDCARAEHARAMAEAKRRYPDAEIVEHCWVNKYGWHDEQTAYLIMVARRTDRTCQPCPRCKGTGMERVVYVHEPHWIEHRADLVDWPCRSCYGCGVAVLKKGVGG